MVAHSSSLLCSVLTVDAMGFPAVCFSPYDGVSRQCESRLPEEKRCWVLLRSCQPCISDSDLLLHRLFVPRTVTWLFCWPVGSRILLTSRRNVTRSRTGLEWVELPSTSIPSADVHTDVDQRNGCNRTHPQSTRKMACIHAYLRPATLRRQRLESNA